MLQLFSDDTSGRTLHKTNVLTHVLLAVLKVFSLSKEKDSTPKNKIKWISKEYQRHLSIIFKIKKKQKKIVISIISTYHTPYILTHLTFHTLLCHLRKFILSIS